jgi:nucleotide-binding universal stress UspA family protein
MEILLPFDGSGSSEQAVRLLEAYRGDRSRITPVVLNVQQPPLHFWPSELVEAKLIESLILEEAQRIAEPALSALKAAGYPAICQGRAGNVAASILEICSARGANAILMGTRGKGGFSGLLLGSVAMRVVQGSTVPVILAKEGMRLPASMGAELRVLLPVDGSMHADKAVAQASQWAAWLGISHAQIMHVTQPITFLEIIAPPHRDALKQWSGAKAEEVLLGAKNILVASRVPCDAAVVYSDDAAGRITQYAADESFDMIVMGTRGLGVVSQAFTGSVAMKVAALSSVPVVLVP